MASSPILQREPNVSSISLIYLMHMPHLLPFLFRCTRTVLVSVTMGINVILNELPGGNIKILALVGFDKLGLLCGRPVDIDTGTLIYICVLRHKGAHNVGDNLHTASEFKRQTICSNLLYQWDFTLVFEG